MKIKRIVSAVLIAEVISNTGCTHRQIISGASAVVDVLNKYATTHAVTDVPETEEQKIATGDIPHGAVSNVVTNSAP